jgi:hypothetical protein
MSAEQVVSSPIFWIALGQGVLLAPAMMTAHTFPRQSTLPGVALGVGLAMITAALVILGPLWLFDEWPVRGSRRAPFSWGLGVGLIISIAVELYRKRRHRRAT